MRGAKHTNTPNNLEGQYVLNHQFPRSWQEEDPEGFPAYPDRRETECSSFPILGLRGH